MTRQRVKTVKNTKRKRNLQIAEVTENPVLIEVGQAVGQELVTKEKILQISLQANASLGTTAVTQELVTKEKILKISLQV